MGLPCSGAAIDPPTGGVDVLLIRVDFPDRPGDPVTDAAGQAIFAQASQLIRDSSWGKFWFETVDVTPTYRMPQASTYYAGREEAGVCELAAAALAAAATRTSPS